MTTRTSVIPALVLACSLAFWHGALPGRVRAQGGSALFEETRLAGGPCEGCEAVFEFGEAVPAPVDTLPDFHRPGPRLKITGTIYRGDGRTPAPGVILYIWHANRKGVYETRGDETGWARRHGRIRGWVKTGADGRYTFYTLRPGTYPDRSEPAHVHPVILEPDGTYYWLDSFLFAGDPLLAGRPADTGPPRGGGSRILAVRYRDGMAIVRRDIILGSHVPGYR